VNLSRNITKSSSRNFNERRSRAAHLSRALSGSMKLIASGDESALGEIA
jgi:hypothetical protein